jgi:hypothetical protein
MPGKRYVFEVICILPNLTPKMLQITFQALQTPLAGLMPFAFDLPPGPPPPKNNPRQPLARQPLVEGGGVAQHFGKQ